MRLTVAQANRLAHTLPLLIPVFTLGALVCTAADSVIVTGLPASLAAVVVGLTRVSQGVTFWIKNDEPTADERVGWWGLWLALISCGWGVLAFAYHPIAAMAVLFAVVSVGCSMWSMLEARAIKREFWDTKTTDVDKIVHDDAEQEVPSTTGK